MNLKRKRLLFGRAATPLTIIVSWLFLFVIGIFSLYIWAGFFAIIIGYIVADLVLEFMMKKRNPKNPRDVFGTYLPAILIGSGVSEIVVYESLSSLSLFYEILFHNRNLVVTLGTSLLIMMLWGRALTMSPSEKERRMKPRRH
ncbi:MAG: hypothetical protein ABSE82_09450 [Nitrososphaerales archaeon]